MSPDDPPHPPAVSSPFDEGDRGRLPAETVAAFAEAFVEAWPTASAASLRRFFSDDASYHNGPMVPAVGHEAVVATLEAMMEMGGTPGMHMIHLVADGHLVMTERVDSWTSASGNVTATLRFAGVFEIHDGRITAWRDYFDLEEFTSQLPNRA
jgi:limonene-1,2-epoxide hydrolase